MDVLYFSPLRTKPLYNPSESNSENFQALIKFQYPYFNINPIIPILLSEKLFSFVVTFTRN